MKTPTVSTHPADDCTDLPDPRAVSLRLVRVTDAPTEQLSLSYEWDVVPGVPAVPPVPVGLHVVGAVELELDPALPDPGPWAARLARAIAEVAIGERPAGQLTRWVARDELARLARRGAAVARHPSARAQRGVSRLRIVRAVRVCTVAPGIVETSAVLVGGARAQAIAIRLEAVADRWLATVVVLGGTAQAVDGAVPPPQSRSSASSWASSCRRMRPRRGSRRRPRRPARPATSRTSHVTASTTARASSTTRR